MPRIEIDCSVISERVQKQKRYQRSDGDPLVVYEKELKEAGFKFYTYCDYLPNLLDHCKPTIEIKKLKFSSPYKIWQDSGNTDLIHIWQSDDAPYSLHLSAES